MLLTLILMLLVACLGLIIWGTHLVSTRLQQQGVDSRTLLEILSRKCETCLSEIQNRSGELGDAITAVVRRETGSTS